MQYIITDGNGNYYKAFKPQQTELCCPIGSAHITILQIGDPITTFQSDDPNELMAMMNDGVDQN